MMTELSELYRKADVLTGRIREAYADVDRAYGRMLREQEDARARAHQLEEELHGVVDDIGRIRSALDVDKNISTEVS